MASLVASSITSCFLSIVVSSPVFIIGIFTAVIQKAITELEGLLAWVACIADAQPIDRYVDYLELAGLSVDQIETRDEALGQTVSDVRGKLLGAELLVKLKKIDLPGADFEQARLIARSAAEAIREGKLGYSLLVASKLS